MVFTHEQITQPAGDECDYVIVGSGPAGATAARVLAGAGEEVIVVEEGPPWPRQRRKPPLYPTMKSAWRDQGTNAAFGSALIPVLQGCALGGTSVINSAIMWRMPEDVVDLWGRDRGIGETITFGALEAAFDKIEREIRIAPVADEAMGRHNTLMEIGCERLGIDGRRIDRAERNCQGSGRCLQGCPNDAKLSMDLTFLPRAQREGARIYATCRVDRVMTEGGRASGVVGRFVDARVGRDTFPLHVRARKGVVVAASAIQSPLLLLRSGLANSSGELGKHFQAHPGAGVVGVFDEEVKMWLGASQGYECASFRDEGFKLETLGLPPELAAARLPGVGSRLVENLRRYPRMTVIAAQIRARAHGRVRSAGGNRPFISFSLTDWDMAVLTKGLRKTCEVHFAAGATEVMPGIFGLPESFRSPDELRVLDDVVLRPNQLTIVATHLFGTCRMGSDPTTSVVSPSFETHDLRDLFVIDSSVFPTNLGLNPQHSIMAMAWVAAERLLDRSR
ncbi:MAG: hypothetical protein CME06_15945 [Gemmatimonadetes bacterium]|nr:hypothetical protein [Gemmatimonadota bacterium]